MPTDTKAPLPSVSVAPLPSLEDAELVGRARAGDERAFEEIVRRYRQPLLRYSARHVGRDHAEDVTQHALAKAAAHLRDDPRPIHLRAWLYRVAHNAAVNLRARKDWSHEELSAEVDGVPQPPELAAQRTEVRAVVSELDRLPERQRAALLMSVFEGRGYDEIAFQLETTPNSVRALLSRARAHLRRAAAAIAPLPILESLMRKASSVLGTSGGGSGTVAAGGSVVQAKLVAIAATAAVVGAASAERGVFGDEEAAAGGVAVAADALPAAGLLAVPFDVDALLPKVERTRLAKRKPAPRKPKKSPAEAPSAEAAAAPAPEPVAEAPPPAEPAPAPSSPAPEAPRGPAGQDSGPFPPGDPRPPGHGGNWSPPGGPPAPPPAGPHGPSRA